MCIFRCALVLNHLLQFSGQTKRLCGACAVLEWFRRAVLHLYDLSQPRTGHMNGLSVVCTSKCIVSLYLSVNILSQLE